MQLSFRRVGVVLILAAATGLVVPTNGLRAQDVTKNEGIKPQVFLKKLFPPVYPPIARYALVAGDVHLKVSVHPDGGIESVTLIDGHPLLVPAALDSARQSQFQCEGCGESDANRTFTYSFEASWQEADPDPCCCSHKPTRTAVSTSKVSQSEEVITIAVTGPPPCTCPDACEVKWALEHSHFRSPKCLYLWKCGHRKIAID